MRDEKETNLLFIPHPSALIPYLKFSSSVRFIEIFKHQAFLKSQQLYSKCRREICHKNLI